MVGSIGNFYVGDEPATMKHLYFDMNGFTYIKAIPIISNGSCNCKMSLSYETPTSLSDMENNSIVYVSGMVTGNINNNVTLLYNKPNQPIYSDKQLCITLWKDGPASMYSFALANLTGY